MMFDRLNSDGWEFRAATVFMTVYACMLTHTAKQGSLDGCCGSGPVWLKLKKPPTSIAVFYTFLLVDDKFGFDNYLA